MWLSAGALILLLGLLLGVLLGPLLGRSALLRRRVGAQAAEPKAPPGERARPDASLAGRLWRWLARIGAAVCLGISALCFYAWYAFYLKWDFNELGRYYDPVEQVVYTSSGAVWILPATVLLAVGMVLLWRGGRRRKRLRCG